VTHLSSICKVCLSKISANNDKQENKISDNKQTCSRRVVPGTLLFLRNLYYHKADKNTHSTESLHSLSDLCSNNILERVRWEMLRTQMHYIPNSNDLLDKEKQLIIVNQFKKANNISVVSYLVTRTIIRLRDVIISLSSKPFSI
jgi:hypothetical protein